MARGLTGRLFNLGTQTFIINHDCDGDFSILHTLKKLNSTGLAAWRSAKCKMSIQ
jgi:hypothetical protein